MHGHARLKPFTQLALFLWRPSIVGVLCQLSLPLGVQSDLNRATGRALFEWTQSDNPRLRIADLGGVGVIGRPRFLAATVIDVDILHQPAILLM
jgi:hypothetical protein